jgi:hypothetical protein
MGLEVSGRIGGDGYASSKITDSLSVIGRLSVIGVSSIGRVEESGISVSSEITDSFSLSSSIDSIGGFSAGKINSTPTSVIGTI